MLRFPSLMPIIAAATVGLLALAAWELLGLVLPEVLYGEEALLYKDGYPRFYERTDLRGWGVALALGVFTGILVYLRARHARDAARKRR